MKPLSFMMIIVVTSTLIWLALSYMNLWAEPSFINQSTNSSNRSMLISENVQIHTKYKKKSLKSSQVYHNWELFEQDYKEMMKKLRIYIYPDAYESAHEFSNVFLPHEDVYNRKFGNYFSEHMFKISLLHSSFVTRNASEAHFFFMPFSINIMRYDPRIRSEEGISRFVEKYVAKIRNKFAYWNRSDGVDHFYVACHSIARNAVSKCLALQQNAIQVTCSANYYQKFYVPHKEISLPQVWPRSNQIRIVPPAKRTRLAFFSGRAQNSRIREDLLRQWSNDTEMDIYGGNIPGSYEDAFSRSKFCLHVKGYEVNTARISDSVNFGCVPVIISNHYDLPLSNILNWRSFSVIVSHTQMASLKNILKNIPSKEYAWLHRNVLRVRKHFRWHPSPFPYDSFHMTVYQLWLRHNFVRPPV